jgi:tRNA dimethylallyltransferase
MSLRLLVIVGPTACGKTRLGVEVAHRLGSEILSADSRQVYIGLDIGTGKDLEEYRRVSPPVPVHLVDLVPPQVVYTLFDFQRDCYDLLRQKAEEEPFASGSVPLVMVGGSGLYVEAVLRQYRIPDVPEDPELRRRLMAEPHDELVQRLLEESPELAGGTDLASHKRVVRALEVAEHARLAPVAYSEPLGVELECAVFGLRCPRAELKRRIGRRLRERLDQGMVAEVEQALRSGVSAERLHLLGLEYREIVDHLAGPKDRQQMVRDLEAAIGRFAKRQMTYFRGMERRSIPITWLDAPDPGQVVELARGEVWRVVERAG